MVDDDKLSEFSEESLRQVAKEIVIKRTILNIHFIIYALVNLFLFVINYTVDYSYQWHWWILTGWGMGMVIHFFSYLIYRAGVVNSSSKGLLYTLMIYFVIVPFLLFINLFTAHQVDWFWWPFGALSAAVLIHVIIIAFIRPRAGDDPNKSWLDRKVDAELRKAKKSQ